jgi:hypothetical protein
MTKQVQRRRGTATQHTSFTGAEGEISVNTTNKSVHVHDGVTAGGVEAARADLSNVSDANLNSALSGNTVASLTITSADINGGTIDGVTIGGASAGAGTFTSVTGTGLTVSGIATITGDLNLGDELNLTATSNNFVDHYGTMRMRYYDGAAFYDTMSISSTATVFNDTGRDLDFRIESDTNTHAFFLQGSDGRIGIGTASPLQSLHVNSSGNTQLLISSTFNNSTITGLTVDTVGDSSVFRLNVSRSGVNQGVLSFLHSSSAALQAWNLAISGSDVYRAGYAEHIWKTGNTERLRITSTGKVGIGDSAPPTILSVRGDTPESRITNTNPISDTGGTEEVARLGVYGQKNSVYGPVANIVFRQDTATWSSADAYHKGTRIEFCTQDATATDTSETPRMVIDKIGRVGIGTSSPTEKLHLSQDSAFAIQMERTGASPSVCEIQNGGSLLNISNNATGIVFLTGGTPTERMRITAAGNVGIGTSSPTNALDVNSDSIRVRTSQTPATASATGNQGEIAWDADYIYICVATNTWKRVAISTW